MCQNRKHTEEENQWLIDNIENYQSYNDMVKDYNKLFNRNYKNGRSLNKYCKTYLGLNKVNRHLWGVNVPTPNENEKYNVGNIIKRANGYYIKLGKDNFYEYGRYLYEQKFGKIPSEDFVIHLDGDRFNNDIDNLYHISKNITAAMSKLDFYGKGKLTIAGAKYCQLINILRK